MKKLFGLVKKIPVYIRLVLGLGAMLLLAILPSLDIFMSVLGMGVATLGIVFCLLFLGTGLIDIKKSLADIDCLNDENQNKNTRDDMED